MCTILRARIYRMLCHFTRRVVLFPEIGISIPAVNGSPNEHLIINSSIKHAIWSTLNANDPQLKWTRKEHFR